MSAHQRLLPVTLFSIAVGLLAWSQLWSYATTLWQLPLQYAHVARGIALSVWFILLVVFVWQRMVVTRLTVDSLKQLTASPLMALLFVATLLASMQLQPWFASAAFALFLVTLLLQLLFSLWWMGRFWQGLQQPDEHYASIYLPAVAQNLVASMAASVFGWPNLAVLLFGAGVFSWLAIESLVMQRAARADAMPAAQRPLQGIQIAPAVVTGLAYLMLEPDSANLLIKMLLGYGCYQLLVAIRLLPWTFKAGAHMGFWSFSFGVMASAQISVLLALMTPAERTWQVLSVFMFALANTVVVVLLGLSFLVTWRGKLLG